MEEVQYWSTVMQESNFLKDMLHWIGWACVKGLKFLADLVGTLVDKIYSLLDFTSYAGMDAFFDRQDIKIVLVCLLIFALVVFAWNLIFNNREFKPKLIQQLCIIMMVVTGLPTIFSFLNTLTNQTRDFIQGGAATNMADQIIADSIVDFKYIDSRGFDKYTVEDKIVLGKKGEKKNGFLSDKSKQKNVIYIDPAEKITDDTAISSKNILLKRIGTNENGTLVVEDIKTQKFLGIDMTDWHYRYSIDYLSIMLCLCATIIAYFFTAWKVAKLIYELAFHQLLAVFMAASDLSTGQRVKAVFKSLGSIYVVLMILPILLKLFVLGQTYVGEHISNGFIKGFVLIAMAFAVVDGPNIIERVLGIDAGIRSGFQSLATAFMVAKGTHSVLNGATKAVGAVGGAVAGAGVGFVQDGIKGYKDARSSDNMQSDITQGGIEEEMKQQNQNTQSSPISAMQNEENNDNSTITDNTPSSNEAGISNDMMNNVSEQVEEQSATSEPSSSTSEPNVDPSYAGTTETKGTSTEQNPMANAVHQNLEAKGITNPTPKANKPRLYSNPQSVIGTVNRAYQNGHVVGSSIKIGNKIGTAIGHHRNHSNSVKQKGDK